MDGVDQKQSIEERQAQLEELLFQRENTQWNLLNRAGALLFALGVNPMGSDETPEELQRRFETAFPVFVATKLAPLVTTLDTSSVRWLLKECLDKFNYDEFGHPDRPKGCSVARIVDAVGAKFGIEGHGPIFWRLRKFETRLRQVQNALTILESERKFAPGSSLVDSRIWALSNFLRLHVHPEHNYCQAIQSLARAIAPEKYADFLWDPFWIPGDEPFTWQVAAEHLGCAADASFQTLVRALGSVDPELCCFEERTPEALLALRLKFHEFLLKIEALEASAAAEEEEQDHSLIPAASRLQTLVDHALAQRQPLFQNLVDAVNQISHHYNTFGDGSPFPLDF